MKYPPAPLTPFLASLPQNPRRAFRCHLLPSRTVQSPSAGASIACALLKSLVALFATPVLYFQWLAASFRKTPGGGYPASVQSSGSPQRANPFAFYHIPATLAFSCDYALFYATAARQTLSPQALTHSFHRNGGVPPRDPLDSASTFPQSANDAIFNDQPMSTHA
jgi:hypothetical protein